MIQIKKVSIDARDRVHITLEETVQIPPATKDGESREITNTWSAECKHKPSEDFKNEFLKLRKFGLDIIGLDDDKTRGKYKVSTMAIAGSIDLETARVMLMLRKDCAGGGVSNISVPFIVLYGEGYAKAGEYAKQVERVITKALGYLGGESGEGADIQLAFKFAVLKAA